MENKMPRPTDSELEILQLLWRYGPSTVRFVNDCLNRTRLVGYTTTLKIMQIMAEKGIARREKKGRQHIYIPVFEEEQTQELLLDRLLESAFGGSAVKLVTRAIDSSLTSAEDLQQLRALLDSLEKEECE